MIRSKSWGTLGCPGAIGAGSSRRIAVIVDIGVSPWNARRPVTISYNNAPNEKMSVRASTFRPQPVPATCSSRCQRSSLRLVCACVLVASSGAPRRAALPGRSRGLDVPRIGDHDVAGLEVPVHHASVMRCACLRQSRSRNEARRRWAVPSMESDARVSVRRCAPSQSRSGLHR